MLGKIKMKPPILLSILLTYTLQVSASALNDSNILFDWAEKNYPQNFSPSGIPTESIGTYLARYYPITNTYIGILGNDVYVLGKVFGDGIIRVGSISDFITTTLESHIKDENFT